jgi:drug/metabolite transporter (DMT)-like permease
MLCGLTIAGLVGTTVKTPILFVPMMIGIPTLFCGVVALNPHRRKHAMRVAGVLALLGTSVGAVRSLVWATRWVREAEIERYAVILNLALLAISGIFLLISVVAFLQDRRRRHAQRSQSIPLRTAVASNSVESRESA